MPEYPSAAQTCADKIKAKIAVGIYPAAEWLPTVKELCEQLDTPADGTVRAALTLLADKQVITHELHVGYYPGSTPPDHGPNRPRHTEAEARPSPPPQVSAAFLDNEFVTVAELAGYRGRGRRAPSTGRRRAAGGGSARPGCPGG
jgi:DNA-binding transcriptional MocR family regulator